MQLVVENLTYRHPIGGLDPALNGITLHLQKGSRTLLIGANGGTTPVPR